MTFIEEAVIGEFISKVSDSAFDISKVKIKQAVENRKNKHQSPESQMYNIVVDVLNKITYGEYENDQDKIYDAAEKILKGFKSGIGNNKDNDRKSIKIGLSDICESVDENKCADFMKLIYRELSKENYSELYREIRLFQEEKEGNKTSRIEQKVDEIQYGVKEVNEKLNKIESDNYNPVINQSQIVKKKSRTQEYADKWNANMFLNNFDKRDENAGVNVKLKDVYLDEHLPHYVWMESDRKKSRTDLKELLEEHIDKKRDNKMLIIFGQPGIGKSTLITWITANFNERVDDILVYQFASDLGNIDWQNDRISNRILDEIGLNRNYLNGKILILDGFDEVSIESVRRRDILDNLYGDWIYNKTIENFSLIITCRENYIQKFAILKCKYITLQSWDEMQVKSFCSIFQEKTKNNISDGTLKKLLENKSILGIPLILYMVLALNISIEEEGSIVDVYDKIFSLEGGIYDRCIDNKSFADKHRIAEIKKQIHQISREIAIWMFENNPDRAVISKKEYENICASVTKEIEQKDIGQDFVIGNFFELKHCEGEKGEELYFVHRSIYEYFVVETIYSSIEDSINILSGESQEKLASNIAIYLKQGVITYTIGEYLLYKIRGLFNKLSVEKKDRFYGWWEETVAKMMEKGMFYYTNKNINYYENIISKECQCFKNIFKILRLFLSMCNEKYVMKSIERDLLEKYIKYCLIEIQFIAKNSNTPIDRIKLDFNYMDLHEINLTGIELKTIYLNHANLSGASLMGVDLKWKSLVDVDFTKASLKKADLEGADLEKSDFRFADLEKVNLKGTNLSKNTVLSGANLSNADLRNVILNKALLHRTILQGTKLNNAVLLFTDLKETNLVKANFDKADLRGADLRGADLHEANFNGANLMYTKFDEEQIAYLTNWDLSKSLVYVEEYDRFADYLKYVKMKNDNKFRETL